MTEAQAKRYRILIEAGYTPEQALRIIKGDYND